MRNQSTIVKVSPKYQIVIPATIRDKAGIQPGLEFEVIISGHGLRLVPLRPLTALRGIIRPDDSAPLRDKRERT